MKWILLVAVVIGRTLCNEDVMLQELADVADNFTPIKKTYHPRQTDTEFTHQATKNQLLSKILELLKQYTATDENNRVQADYNDITESLHGNPIPGVPWKREKMFTEEEFEGLPQNMKSKFNAVRGEGETDKETREKWHSVKEYGGNSDGKQEVTSDKREITSVNRRNELYGKLMSDISELVYDTDHDIESKRNLKTRLVKNINSMFSIRK